MKLFYLVLRSISQKWTMPIRDWKAALTRFNIQFEDRMNNFGSETHVLFSRSTLARSS